MIEKILIEERIPYKVIDEDKGCKLIKINSKMHLFYIKLNKKSNWIKSCFQTCDKESIYLGKQVLNSRLDEKELRKVLKK